LLTVGTDGAVNQPRIERSHFRAGEPQSLGSAWTHVVDENIGIHHQAFQLGNVLRLAEVKRHGPFVAIDCLKRRAVIVP
jgi:hypothetical protein